MNAFRHCSKPQQGVDDLLDMPLVLSADGAVENMGTGFLQACKSKERCLLALFSQLQCQTPWCVGRPRASVRSCCVPFLREPLVPATMVWQSAASPYGNPPRSMQGLVVWAASAAASAVAWFCPSLHRYVLGLVLSFLRAGGSYFCLWPCVCSSLMEG